MQKILYLAAALAAAAPMSAQTVVTPTSLNGWQLQDGKGNGDPATITTAQPRNGNGSLQFNITAGNQQPLAYFQLSELVPLSVFSGRDRRRETFGFDFLADNNQVVAPTFRLLLGGLANTGGSQYGSFGYFGDTGAGWQTANLSKSDGDFFLRVSGKGQLNVNCQNDSYTQNFGVDQRQTITDWIDGSCNNLGNALDLSNAYIYGIEVDYGSFPGITSPTTVYADAVNFDFSYFGTDGETTQSGDFNFETDADTTSTPEPASVSLLAIGLVGIAGAARRKRAR